MLFNITSFMLKSGSHTCLISALLYFNSNYLNVNPLSKCYSAAEKQWFVVLHWYHTHLLIM